MKLSPRLLKLASKVPEESVVADVGTDHAMLPIYLVSTGRCPRAIAIETAEGPYRQAQENIRQFGLEDFIGLRLADGLHGLGPGEVDVVVVAGLGGGTMVEILSGRPDVARSIPRWILQPMRGGEVLRRFVIENGYRLVDEELVREGNYLYEIIVARPGREEIQDDILFEVGPRLLERRDPLLGEFLREKVQHYRRLLLQVGDPPSARGAQALTGFQEKIRKLGLILQQLEAGET